MTASEYDRWQDAQRDALREFQMTKLYPVIKPGQSGPCVCWLGAYHVAHSPLEGARLEGRLDPEMYLSSGQGGKPDDHGLTLNTRIDGQRVISRTESSDPAGPTEPMSVESEGDHMVAFVISLILGITFLIASVFVAIHY